MATRKPVKGKDLSSFRAIHDKAFRIPLIIKNALKDLGDSWEYEGEFLKRSGISTTDMAVYRDQFTPHWFEVRANNRNVKRIWCGTAKYAAKLQEFYQ